MTLITKLDPLLDHRYSSTKLKRLVLGEKLFLQLFQKGTHLPYDIHSDEVPADGYIMDVIFERKFREFHIVIKSDNFEYVKPNEAIPYLIPFAVKVTDAK